MRCIVFHNASSGWGNHNKSAIKSALKLAGFDTTFQEPDRETLDDHKLSSKADLIVAAGGDGTVAKIVTRLADRRVPVAIIPLGTANNIARSLGVFGQPVDLAESWDITHSTALDIGAVTGQWGRAPFVEAFGVGLFAKLIRKGGKLESKGGKRLADGRALLAKLTAKAAPISLRARIDGQDIGGDIIAFEATSIAYCGPGLKLAGTARPGDGMIDIVTLPTENRERFIAWIEAHCEGPAPVVVRRTKRLEVSWADAPYRIDDTAFEQPDHRAEAMIELDKPSIHVLARPPSPHVPNGKARDRKKELTRDAS